MKYEILDTFSHFFKSFAQDPNICSKGKCPVTLPLLAATVWLLISLCFNDVLSI